MPDRRRNNKGLEEIKDGGDKPDTISSVNMASGSQGSMEQYAHMDSNGDAKKAGKSYTRGDSTFMAERSDDLIDSSVKDPSSIMGTEKSAKKRRMKKNEKRGSHEESDENRENNEDDTAPIFINIEAKLALIKQYILRR